MREVHIREGVSIMLSGFLARGRRLERGGDLFLSESTQAHAHPPSKRLRLSTQNMTITDQYSSNGRRMCKAARFGVRENTVSVGDACCAREIFANAKISSSADPNRGWHLADQSCFISTAPNQGRRIRRRRRLATNHNDARRLAETIRSIRPSYRLPVYPARCRALLRLDRASRRADIDAGPGATRPRRSHSVRRGFARRISMLR